LLKGVVYKEDSPEIWSALLQLQAAARDYVRVLGLGLVLDEAEGYAFLRSLPEQPDSTPLPRLIVRRQLTFPVSLLLALLRKKLAEFDAGGDDTRLILSRDAIVEMMRLFNSETTNESRVVEQVDAHINKVVDLGFLRPLNGVQDSFEVRRILKAFVDAQWLTDFDERLSRYRLHLADKEVPSND
jgi:hypothetical protein